MGRIPSVQCSTLLQESTARKFYPLFIIYIPFQSSRNLELVAERPYYYNYLTTKFVFGQFDPKVSVRVGDLDRHPKPNVQSPDCTKDWTRCLDRPLSSTVLPTRPYSQCRWFSSPIPTPLKNGNTYLTTVLLPTFAMPLVHTCVITSLQDHNVS